MTVERILGALICPNSDCAAGAGGKLFLPGRDCEAFNFHSVAPQVSKPCLGGLPRNFQHKRQRALSIPVLNYPDMTVLKCSHDTRIWAKFLLDFAACEPWEALPLNRRYCNRIERVVVNTEVRPRQLILESRIEKHISEAGAHSEPIPIRGESHALGPALAIECD